jgi:hypothetical protein
LEPMEVDSYWVYWRPSVKGKWSFCGILQILVYNTWQILYDIPLSKLSNNYLIIELSSSFSLILRKETARLAKYVKRHPYNTW